MPKPYSPTTVVLTVTGGCVHVAWKPVGITLHIVDEDCGEQDTWEAQEELGSAYAAADLELP